MRSGSLNRKRFDPAFKARVALEAVQERESLAQLGKKCGVHPVLVGQWKKQLLAKTTVAFTRDSSQEAERLQDELLKKSRIDMLYLERPYYGSRRMTVALRHEGLEVNRKRVQRLMRLMGLSSTTSAGNFAAPVVNTAYDKVPDKPQNP